MASGETKKNIECEHCYTDNPADAVYCRYCGLPFDERVHAENENADMIRMSRKWKQLKSWKRPITGFLVRMVFVVVLGTMLGALGAGLANYMDGGGERLVVELPAGLTVGLLTLIIGYIYCKKQLPGKGDVKNLSDICDKIQPYCYLGVLHSRRRPIYKIYIKNHKAGLLNVTNYCIAIRAKYSMMKWKESQRILTVCFNGDRFDIDVKGDFV